MVAFVKRSVDIGFKKSQQTTESTDTDNGIRSDKPENNKIVQNKESSRSSSGTADLDRMPQTHITLEELLLKTEEIRTEEKT